MSKVLLCGINTYPNNSTLNGCVNDVIIMRELLLFKYKYQAQNLRLITDNRATKQNIIDRLKWLVTDAKDNDKLVFYYSGHGSRIVNRNYEEDYEPDGYDECLVPVDYNIAGMIVDDELSEIFKKLNPKATLVCIFDCCHSGTMTRNLNTLPPKIVSKDKFLVPNIDMLSRTSLTSLFDIQNNTFKSEEVFQKPVNNKIINITKQPNIIAITGCQDNQTSADAYFVNRFQGALSYYMQKQLILDKEYKLTYLSLLQLVSADLRNAKFTQIPNLICDDDNKRFELFLKD